MDKQKLYEIMEKIFSISKEEVDDMLSGENRVIKTKKDAYRLSAMLDAVVPYCEKWLDATDKNGNLLVDEKLKRKAGKVFLEKLDYSTFVETEMTQHTYSRLSELFYQTSKRHINPYKIIYCGVLTDGNISRGDASLVTRNFVNIYNTLRDVLQTTDEETAQIFEKCGATLIGKCYTFRIDNRPHSVFDELYNEVFVVTPYDETRKSVIKYRIFREKEVIEILKNAPSLFDSSYGRISSGFDYIKDRIKIQLDKGENIKLWEKQLITLRKVFKNNPSLFKLSVDDMLKKENYFGAYAKTIEGRKHAVALKELFCDVINIGLMSVIKKEQIQRYSIKNIQTLDRYFSTEDVNKYIVNNPFVLAMKSGNFSLLMEEIFRLDKENLDKDYMDRFLTLGRTLFKNSADCDVQFILNRLVKNDLVIELDVDNMKPSDSVGKFIEIFCDGNKNLEQEIFELICEKKSKMEGGEKNLRKSIRQAGAEIVYLPKILKDNKISMKDKRERILSLAKDVDAITKTRYRLSGCEDIYSVRKAEQEDGRKVEEMLNTLRDVFEQKRFHVGKRFTNTDKLFEKMMNYLGECFDDKKAIADLFEEEIAIPFKDVVETNFKTKKQDTLLSQNIVVEVDEQVKKPLKDLAKSIVLGQDYDANYFEFVSKNQIEKEKDCTK